jgi:hypothetical protein
MALKHYNLPMADTYVPAWVKVLEDAEYPTDVLVIDFETYFDDDFSLSNLSTVEYITDPRYETLGVACLLMHGDKAPFAEYEHQVKFWGGSQQTISHLNWLRGKYGDNLEKLTVVIQNANFDALILRHHYNINPPHIIDVKLLARHWNARARAKLAVLAKEFGLPEKGDTAEFKGLSFRRRMMIPKGRAKSKMPVQRPIITDEQIKQLVSYAENDAMREWELFTILLPRLTRPEFELRAMQHTLDMFLKPTLRVDRTKADSLVQRMEQEIDKTLDTLNGYYPKEVIGLQVPVTRESISSNTEFERYLTRALERAGDNPQSYYKPCKRGMMLATAKDDPEREKLLKHPDQKVRAIMEARTAVKSWPLHIARLQSIKGQAAALNGLLGVPLTYYGAHTGRWSGGEGINLQNLGSRGHELVNAVREILIAPEGHKLVIVDASQIEARVLAWIAGESELVGKFARNEEIYCGFATKVLGWPVRKPKKEGGIPAVEARMKWARNSIGKIGVLGCGYGMGQERIFEMGQGSFDLETALRIRDTYRSEHSRIVQFWGDIEKAFKYTARYGNECTLPRGLRFSRAEGADVVLTLPCGRSLFYHQVRIVPRADYGESVEVWNDTEHHWGYTWGGSLTENVVQAMSRDILAEAVLWLEDQGYHTALHVHDEVVMVVPDHAGPELVKQLAEHAMSKTPAWATGCPLGAEGAISERYGGH